MRLNLPAAWGQVIVAARMLAGLHQEQLATEAGLAPFTVSEVEKGRHNLREAILRAVQHALERQGIDLAQNDRTGHHAVDTSYA